MKQKLLGSLFIGAFLFLLSLAVILYGRGWRLDFKKKSLKSTGLLAATSNPAGASVFIDGRLVSATNDTINLDPGWYQVRLLKEGYLPWEKKIEIKKEIVAETKATLFPKNPSLSPLTSTGVKAPSLSSDGGKIAYLIPYQPTLSNSQSAKYGVFVLDLNSHPLPFLKKPRQIFSFKILPSEKASLLWSPDSSSVLLLKEKAAFLLDPAKKNKAPVNLIGTLPSLFSSWEKEKQSLEKRKLLSLPEPLAEFFRSSTKILSWAPDNSKILYQATASATLAKVIKPPLLATNSTEETRKIEPGKIYVYDRKEDRNYRIEIEKLEIKTSRKEGEENTLNYLITQLLNYSALQWLPTSRHLILAEENKISILEYDGTNKATIYAHPLEENFVAPFPDASKLIILTSLNPTSNTLPDLYTLSLK